MSDIYLQQHAPGRLREPGGPARSLLHLDSSASRPGDSTSRQLTALFAETWRRRHPGAEYRYRDLAAHPVSLISSDFVALGLRSERRGNVPLGAVSALAEGPGEAREWSLTLPLINEVRAAGTVLLGVPMYNFSVPAALKAWIDRITFPGAFTDAVTGESVLRDTEVVVVTARGGCYLPGTPREDFDFQTCYLRAYFTELGVPEDNLHVIHAEMTRAGDVPKLARFQVLGRRSLAEARSEILALAAPRPDAEPWPAHPDGRA
ncbi:FMN-dependent NADH-azoreductase [Spongiactinospora sp. 9N601]|uniref:FMN-dependent NADH-azoreductase n=1 Tax=Spongiactinospora sp. 9N601 TaxID=3375149 RepID=UPI00378DE437